MRCGEARVYRKRRAAGATILESVGHGRAAPEPLVLAGRNLRFALLVVEVESKADVFPDPVPDAAAVEANRVAAVLDEHFGAVTVAIIERRKPGAPDNVDRTK